MPENETLIYDARTANRWQPIKQRIDQGLTPTEAFPDIEEQFYRSLQRVWRQWRACGVDPSELFEAALHDRRKFEELVRQANWDRNARLLDNVAAGLEHQDMAGLIGEFIDAGWEEVRSQLQLDRHDDALSPEFEHQIREVLDRISSSLARNPSRFPSHVRTRPPADVGAQLAEPLI